MNDKINGRTPEEIKKGLELCAKCSTFCSHVCPYYELVECGAAVKIDTLALIQQLERERDEARNDLDTINYANIELHSAYEAMKRERDAAVNDMRELISRMNAGEDVMACEYCAKRFGVCNCNCLNEFELRGVEVVN